MKTFGSRGYGVKILDRYIVREILPWLGLWCLAATFMLVLDKIFVLMQLKIEKGVELAKIGKLLLYILPASLSIAIPMGVVMGILFALSRLAGDSEITALRANGVSGRRIILPCVVLGVATTLVTWLCVDILLPRGNYRFRSLHGEIVGEHPMVMMESGVWTTLEVDGGVVDLKAERVDDRTGMMTNVIIRERIEDRGGRGIVVSRVSSARAGWWEKNPDKNTKTLSLVESTKLSSEEKGQETVTSARVARRNFPLRASVVRAPARGPREKTSWELWAEIRDFRKRGVPAYYQRVELHKKFSIPFACLAFALLAAPLGIAVKRGGKGAGLVNGVFIIFGYYIFLTMGEQLGKNAKVHEFFLAGRSAVAEGWWIGGAVCMISSWLPNLLFGGAGAFAVHRATGRLKREIRFLDVIQERIERFAAKYIDHREDAGGGAP